MDMPAFHVCCERDTIPCRNSYEALSEDEEERGASEDVKDAVAARAVVCVVPPTDMSDKGRKGKSIPDVSCPSQNQWQYTYMRDATRRIASRIRLPTADPPTAAPTPARTHIVHTAILVA